MTVKTRLLRATFGSLLLGAWLGISAAPAAAQTAVRPLDRVVAVVNDQVITASQLASRAAAAAREIRLQNRTPPPADVLEKQVLERLIVDLVQAQRARDQGIRVDDSGLERAIEGIARENRLTVAQLRERVERDGLPFAAFREQVRAEIVRVRLREREVDAKVQVSEADIDAFLAEQEAAASAEPEFLLAQVLLRLPENPDAPEVERQRARGEEIIRQLRGGAEFERVLASFTGAADAPSGGSLGWRSAERLPKLFADAASGLRVGEVSNLLRSGAGFHVLKLFDKRGGSVAGGPPIVQTRVRHILIRPSTEVSEAEALRRLREIKTRVETGTGEFAALARQYSVDGSAGNGGDLGWIYPGETVPEFERAMNELAPGRISDPVQTAFGFHLIEVLERREDAASPERRRQMARQALRAQRIEEAYDNFLNQLRDSAYVEYRLDAN